MYNGEIKVEKANITSVLKTAEDLKIEALKDVSTCIPNTYLGNEDYTIFLLICGEVVDDLCQTR